jgi:polyhydroxyalkanoate synthesis regulator phasin
MADTLRKLLLAGLGALDLTEEKAKAIFNELVARGEISEKDAKDVISGWKTRAAEQRGRLQEDVEKAVAHAMSTVGLARRTEVEALAVKVATLEAKLAARGASEPESKPS